MSSGQRQAALVPSGQVAHRLLSGIAAGCWLDAGDYSTAYNSALYIYACMPTAGRGRCCRCTLNKPKHCACACVPGKRHGRQRAGLQYLLRQDTRGATAVLRQGGLPLRLYIRSHGATRLARCLAPSSVVGGERARKHGARLSGRIAYEQFAERR